MHFIALFIYVLILTIVLSSKIVKGKTITSLFVIISTLVLIALGLDSNLYNREKIIHLPYFLPVFVVVLISHSIYLIIKCIKNSVKIKILLRGGDFWFLLLNILLLIVAIEEVFYLPLWLIISLTFFMTIDKNVKQ